METQETTEEAPTEASGAPAETLAALSALLKPYQTEWKRRERLAKFVAQCIRAGQRDEFLELADLLAQKEAKEVASDPDLPSAADHLSALRTYLDTRIEAYRLQFVEELAALAAEAELPLQIDFPNLSGRKGITGTVDFSGRKTTVNEEVLKTIDPKRILAALQRLDKRLYGRPFDPAAFIDGLFSTYNGMIEADHSRMGEPMPIRDFYLQHVLSLQSNSFLQDFDERKFRGYPLDELSADLWRFFSSDVSRTSSGHVLSLRPGRDQALWLYDHDGERRQIAALAFEVAS
jgi:hypothetical protein